jgi:hypothetical protein
MDVEYLDGRQAGFILSKAIKDMESKVLATVEVEKVRLALDDLGGPEFEDAIIRSNDEDTKGCWHCGKTMWDYQELEPCPGCPRRIHECGMCQCPGFWDGTWESYKWRTEPQCLEQPHRVGADRFEYAHQIWRQKEKQKGRIRSRT